jgi:hypothetical protein
MFRYLFPLLLLSVAVPAAVEIPPMARSGGTVYLRVAAGTTHVMVRKRDLNIYAGGDVLRVTVSDPLMRVVEQAEIPDDGMATKGARAESLQERSFSIASARAGVVRVKIEPNGDMVWGLRSDAEKLMVDGTMMLNAPEFSARLYFAPPKGTFLAEIQAIHSPGFQTVPLLDAGGRVVHRFALVKANEYVPFEVPAEAGDRNGLWQVEVGKADVMLRLAEPCRWTLDPTWWFDLPDQSWRLLPRQVVRYAQPGDTVAAQLYLYAPRDVRGDVVAEALKEEQAPRLAVRVARVNKAPVPGTSAAAVLDVELAAPRDAKPGETFTRWLVAGVGTESAVAARLDVRIGESPVGKPLKLPIVERPHAHEDVQFGYAPDYVTNEVYFTPDDRTLIRNRDRDRDWTSAVLIRERGKWLERPFTEALDQSFPAGWSIRRGAGFMNCKVVADTQGGLYTALCTRHPDKVARISLLYSFDDGQSWQVVAVPGSAYDIENFSGHNTLTGPTPLLVYAFRAKHSSAKWGAYHDLLLYLPKREGDRLVLGDPIPITDDCLGSCQHSGGPPSLATRDGRTHVIWAQAVETDLPGVPTFIATVDHATRRVSPHVLLGYAPPLNDVHNVPAVCFDSTGILHIVTGAHGQNFVYRHSLKPNDTQSGFSEPIHTLDAGYVTKDSDADGLGRQTYCSLVCDDQDTLHIAFRQWRQGVDSHHGGANYAALSMQSKPKGKPWGPARPMVVAPLPGYSIYYHKLTVAPDGSLWLSYSYLSGTKSYQEEFPELYNNCAILVSKDHGKTWTFALGRDFPDGTNP